MKRITLNSTEVELLADLLETEWDLRAEIHDRDAASESAYHIGKARTAAILFERVTGQKSAWLERERTETSIAAFERAILRLPTSPGARHAPKGE